MDEHVHRKYNPTLKLLDLGSKVGRKGSCEEVVTTLGYGLEIRKVLDLGMK